MTFGIGKFMPAHNKITADNPKIRYFIYACIKLSFILLPSTMFDCGAMPIVNNLLQRGMAVTVNPDPITTIRFPANSAMTIGKIKLLDLDSLALIHWRAAELTAQKHQEKILVYFIHL